MIVKQCAVERAYDSQRLHVTGRTYKEYRVRMSSVPGADLLSAFKGVNSGMTYMCGRDLGGMRSGLNADVLNK